MGEPLLPEPIPSPTDGGVALHDWANRMRETSPVCRDQATGMWLVFPYDQVLNLLRDHENFSSDMSPVIPDKPFRVGNIAEMDPPDHRKYRSLASRAFTPRTVADLEPRIAEITHKLLDAVAGEDRFELVEALTYPLPITVISELLGVPESDHGLFLSWVDDLLYGTHERPFEADAAKRASDAIAPLQAYLREHVVDRRAHPREDLITKLVAAEVDGERMTDEEVVTFSAILLLAGHVTTTMLLGNTVSFLGDNPTEWAKLRAEPALVPAALEESLRMKPPFTAAPRVTKTEVEIGGVTIPAGQPVFGVMLAANFDPRYFDHVEAYDVTRFGPGREQSAHLGFGHGIHFCIGAPLARLEGRIVLEILLERFQQIRRDPDQEAEFFASHNFNGPRRLPVVVTR